MTDLAAYRPFWHPIAHISEITTKPQQFVLLTERLVVFRTSKGISCFKDVCIHRGMELSRGRVIDDTIECPYHGWRYDNTGTCVKIPSLSADKPIPSKARAVSYPVREMYDCVFVALEEPVLETLQLPPAWAYDNPELRTCLVGIYDWGVDAGRMIENALDTSHFSFVHDGTLGNRETPFVPDYDVVRDNYSFEFVYDQLEPGEPSAGHDGMVRLCYTFHAPFGTALKREVPGDAFTALYLFASPMTASRCRFFMMMSRNFDKDPSRDPVYVDFVRKANDEDESMIEGVHPEQIPTDLREELHIKGPDAAGIAFRQILGRIEAEHRTRTASRATPA